MSGRWVMDGNKAKSVLQFHFPLCISRSLGQPLTRWQIGEEKGNEETPSSRDLHSMDAVKHLFRRKRKPKVPSNVSITHNEAQSSTSSLEETSVHPVAVEEVSAARLETLTGEGDTKVVLNTF